MAQQKIENRLAALEKAVAELQDRIHANGNESVNSRGEAKWLIETAGRFRDDPGFEEMVRLGREYRESLRPKPRKKRSARAKKK